MLIVLILRYFYFTLCHCEKEFHPFLCSNHYSKTFSSNARVMKRCLIRLPTIKGNKIVLRLEGVRGSDTTT